METPSFLEMLKQSHVFLLFGPASLTAGIWLTIRWVRQKNRSRLLFSIFLVLWGALVSFATYRGIWLAWQFRNELASVDVVSLSIQELVDEQSLSGGRRFEITDHSTVDQLLSDLQGLKAYHRDHESFLDGYQVRFHLADGSFSRAWLMIWSKSSRGYRYVVYPQVSSSYDYVNPEPYESYLFVHHLMQEISRQSGEHENSAPLDASKD